MASKPIVSAARVRSRIGLARADETIEVAYLRNGTRLKADAPLAAATP